MTLTVKTQSSARNTSGAPQSFRGDGASSVDVSPGAGKVTQFAVGEYDFTKDGAITGGTTVFGTGVFVPANAIVIRSGLFNDVVMAGMTTGHVRATLYGAQVAATDSADANLVVDATVASVIDGSVIGTVVAADDTTWLHTGASPREILIDVSAAGSGNTTAGRTSVWCEYIIVENTLS